MRECLNYLIPNIKYLQAACACITHKYGKTEPIQLPVILTIEDYIEGLVDLDHIIKISNEVGHIANNYCYKTNSDYHLLGNCHLYALANLCYAARFVDENGFIFYISNCLTHCANVKIDDNIKLKLEQEYKWQDDLIKREFVGSNLIYKFNSTSVAISKTIYNEKKFEEMPVLADSLEDSGANCLLVDHCREPEHYRGCWVLDLIRGQF